MGEVCCSAEQSRFSEAEILDFIRRTDNLYITRRRDGLLSVSKLSAEFRRNDIKISDLFLSNYPGGTAPKSDTLLKFSFFKGLTLYGNSP